MEPWSSRPEERLAALRGYLSTVVNQYGVLLRHADPAPAGCTQGAVDEARLRSAALAITASCDALVQLVSDLRLDDVLLRAERSAAGDGGGSAGGGADGSGPARR